MTPANISPCYDKDKSFSSIWWQKIKRVLLYVSMLFPVAFCSNVANGRVSFQNLLSNSVVFMRKYLVNVVSATKLGFVESSMLLLTLDVKDEERLFQGYALLRRLVSIDFLDEGRINIDLNSS